MAGLDLAALTGPVSADDPCGPDLDLEGDPDYFNFLARAEGLLPASFFSGPDGGPFDRSAINFDNEFAAMAPLFERTRDLRLAALLARLHILNRNIAGFSMAVSAIAQLVDEQWEGVHPRGEDGDFLLRMTAIETLDDMPTVVLPMQFLPLALHRRAGQINYRGYLIATGEVRAREGEEALDTGSIDRALMEVDLPPLIETMRQFDAVNKTLLRIRQIWIDRAGFDQAVAIEKSAQLAGRIVTLLNGVVARRDPAAALGEAAGAPASDADGQDGAAAAGAPPAAAAPAAGAPISLGRIKSRDEVTEAFAAIADYFVRAEPSSPTLLLVRQAQQLVGCSFVDAMRILMPGYFDQTNISVGGPQVFDLPLERLSPLVADIGVTPPVDDSAGWGQPAPEPGEEQGASPASDASPARATMTIGNRQQALALLDQIGVYYRSAEPTSPVPVIIERARRVAERDFMSLLKDFLPEDTLRSIRNDGG